MVDKMTSCLTWPFVALWRLLAVILNVTGRLLAIVAGVLLMIVGVVVSFTIVGAAVGIPLVLFGMMLIARGLF